MQNKSLLIIVGLVIVIGIGAFVYAQKNASLSPSANTPENTPPTTETGNGMGGTATSTTSTPAPSGMTLAQVAQHNSRTSCWAAINGGVYDLTSWIPNHPGGEQAILSLCGKDGTTAFNNQHSGNKRVLSVLSGFKIGLLAQ